MTDAARVALSFWPSPCSFLSFLSFPFPLYFCLSVDTQLSHYWWSLGHGPPNSVMLHWPNVVNPLRYSLILARNGQHGLMVSQTLWSRQGFLKVQYVCVCSAHMTFLTLAVRWTRKAISLWPSFRGVSEVKSDCVFQANAEFANLASLFDLECLSRFKLCQYIPTLSWQEECCQALPPARTHQWRLDELSDSWDLHAVMPASAPAVQPLPFLLYPRLYWGTPPASRQEGTGGSLGVPHDLLRCGLSAIQPACSMGLCKHFWTHPLRWMLANLGCGQSHVGQQPVSVCMCVRVSSSIWVNSLQCDIAALTLWVVEWTIEW